MDFESWSQDLPLNPDNTVEYQYLNYYYVKTYLFITI